MIPYEIFDTVSQSAHFFSAAFVVYLFNGNPWVAAMLVALTAVKEWWYDYKYESAAVRGSSIEDAIFYWLGIAAAIALCRYGSRIAAWLLDYLPGRERA